MPKLMKAGGEGRHGSWRGGCFFSAVWQGNEIMDGAVLRAHAMQVHKLVPYQGHNQPQSLLLTMPSPGPADLVEGGELRTPAAIIVSLPDIAAWGHPLLGILLAH
eukprot:8259666-Heterocapsa_arctica.AAC.1